MRLQSIGKEAGVALRAFPAFQTLSVRSAFTLSAGEWCIVGVGAAVIVGAIVAAVVISKKKKKK